MASGTTAALVLVPDHEGKVVLTNPAWRDKLGCSNDVVLGHPIWDSLLVPEDAAPVRELSADLQGKADSNSFEDRLVAADVTRRNLPWSNAALRDEAGRAL
jgi:PAS domain S-box-containing protein